MGSFTRWMVGNSKTVLVREGRFGEFGDLFDLRFSVCTSDDMYYVAPVVPALITSCKL